MAKLTTKFVTKVQSDNIKVFWDDQLKGFGLCVRPSGKKTFLLKYRIGRGRRALCQKKSIGSLPIMSVEAARLKAKNFFQNRKIHTKYVIYLQNYIPNQIL